MSKTVALIGNPNCGKTTLFNTITGTYQKTGNWAGVTVEKKEGRYKKDKEIKVIDLPGIYSFNAISDDEEVVVSYLRKTPPDLLINVVDGTNLARNLYLTCLISTLNIPTIIAVNFSDELQKNDIYLNAKNLANLFGVYVVEVSALKNKNVDKLMALAKLENNPVNSINKDYYQFIDDNLPNVIEKKQTKTQRFTKKADAILLNKYCCIPIFFAVVTLIYFFSVSIGGRLGEVIENTFISFAEKTEYLLSVVGAPDWLNSLLCRAVISGLGAVLGFLPQILVLFTLLTLLEECGYASRMAFILDSILRKAGLSGKSFLPLMVSSGCTVTGLMATKTIDSSSEKRTTVFLSPFIPCGAKMAVFGWLSQQLFDGNPFIASSLYFLSIIVIIVVGMILKKFPKFSEEKQNFILEIPPLRPPSLKDVLAVLLEKVKDFLLKAGTIVFVISIILWALKSFGVNGYTEDVSQSFLFIIGNGVKYVFYPLGFGTWEASVSILSGFLAKESVVETMCFISADPQSIFSNGFSAYAFMAFIMLSPPCIASIVGAKNQLMSKKLLFYMLLMEIIVAYLVALFINVVGHIITGQYYLIFAIIIGIILLEWFKTALKGFVSPCNSCRNNSCNRKKFNCKG